MVDPQPLTMKRFGHPAITITGKLKDNRLNQIPKIRFLLELIGESGFGLVIAASGETHQLAPPLDSLNETSVVG